MAKTPRLRPTPQSENRLLARLPPDKYGRLRPSFTPIALAVRQVLHPARQPIEFIYIPTWSVASAVARMEDKAAIEIASTGSEVATGVTALLGLLR